MENWKFSTYVGFERQHGFQQIKARKSNYSKTSSTCLPLFASILIQELQMSLNYFKCRKTNQLWKLTSYTIFLVSVKLVCENERWWNNFPPGHRVVQTNKTQWLQFKLRTALRQHVNQWQCLLKLANLICSTFAACASTFQLEKSKRFFS